MQSTRFQLILLSSLVVVLSAGQAMAQPSDAVCDDAGGPTICVRFDNLSVAPVENVDFDFDFTDSDNPSVDLTKGRDALGTLLEWRVWSTSSFGIPLNMGNLTAGGADDYDVKLLNASGGAGAVNVKKIDLDPSDTANFSNLSACHITGNLTGILFVQEPALGTGGIIDGIDIGGNITGPVTVPTFKGVNTFGGTVTNDITIGVIDGAGAPRGKLTITGAISGDIDITGKLDGGDLNLLANVPAGSTITIEEMDEGDMKFSGDFAGSLIFTNGMPALSDIAIIGLLSGSIDLTGDDLGGQINLFSASADATVDGGDIVGVAIFYPSQGSATNSFDGTATFTSVAAGAEIESSDGAHIGGTICVTGDVAGEVAASSGSLKSGGLIDIDGNMSGEVHIGLDCVGNIDIGGDVSGDIQIDGDQIGSVTVGGALVNALGVGAARILVAGESSGPIKVGEKTGSLTLIQVAGGLATGGRIEINTTRGAHNADGDIHIGGTTPAELPFDGCIRIYEDGFGGSGNLN